ncbi:hypothetical protein [Spirosoma flavum]|uniref:hypothetical protein n=1 Tax=Spirosoma flavum TaxID=2048557 RepID=UPI0036D27031
MARLQILLLLTATFNGQSGLFPKYENLFPGEPVPDLLEVLPRTSSIPSLKTFALMNFKIHPLHTNLGEQEEMFRKWTEMFDDKTRTFRQLSYLATGVHNYSHQH